MRHYYDADGVTIYHGDCIEWFDQPVITKVDHVITDPPYSEHVHSKQRRGGNADRNGVVSEGRELGFGAISIDTIRAVAPWLGLVALRWIAVFSDSESAHLWREAIVEDGNAEYVRTMFWRKIGGAPQFTGDRPAVACEAKGA